MDFEVYYYLSEQDKKTFIESLSLSERDQYLRDYDLWFFNFNNILNSSVIPPSSVPSVELSPFPNTMSNASEDNNFLVDNRFQAIDGIASSIDTTNSFIPPNSDTSPPLTSPLLPSSPSSPTTRSISLVARYCDNGKVSGSSKFISTEIGPGDSDSFFANFISIQTVIFRNELRAKGFTDINIGTQLNLPISPKCNTIRDTLLRASFCNKGIPEFKGKPISVEVGPGDSDSFFANFVSIQSILFKNELESEGYTKVNVTSGVNPPAPNCNTTRDILLRASFCNKGMPEFRGKPISVEVGPGNSDSFFDNFVSIQTVIFKNELRAEGYTEVNVTSGVNPPNPNCTIAQIQASVQFQECDGTIVQLRNSSRPPAPSLTINGKNLPLDRFGPTTYESFILGDNAYIYRELTNLIYTTPGTYTVTFGDVPGWVTPNPASFTLNSNKESKGGNEAVRIYKRPGCDPPPPTTTTTTFNPNTTTTTFNPNTTTTTFRPTTTTTTTTTLRIPDANWLKRINSTDNRRYVFDVTEGLFSNNIRNLVTFFTGSTSENYSRYYTHVYDENPKTSLTSSIQFSIAYGHSGGSGSLDEGNKINITPTRAIYSQYRNLVLGKSNIKFNLTGRETDSIYIINYQSKRLKDRLNAGVLELNIAHLSGSQFLAGGGTISTHTGSNVKLAGNNRVLRLIDDSKISTSPDYTDVGYSYNIVSGTLETGVYNQTAPHYYGKLIPSLGVVILDGNKLDLSASFATSKASEIEGYNAIKLYKSFSGSALVQDNSGDYLGMKARRVIREYNDYYFIRVLNNEYNFTNNPSRIKLEVPDFMVYKDADPGNPHWKTNLGLPLIPLPVDPTSLQGLEDIRRRTLLKLENGEISEPFVNNSQVYITTVGLYNAQRELIAVGKLPKPILKNFTEESIFTVKLKY